MTPVECEPTLGRASVRRPCPIALAVTRSECGAGRCSVFWRGLFRQQWSILTALDFAAGEPRAACRDSWHASGTVTSQRFHRYYGVCQFAADSLRRCCLRTYSQPTSLMAMVADERKFLMSTTRRRASLLLIPAAAAMGIGLAAPAAAFNPQPDPPGKPIAVEHLERFVPPDPVRQSVPIQVHQRVITRLGGTPTDIP